MSTTAVLREKVKKYIDHADKKSLLIIERILEHEKKSDWWDTLPESVQSSIKNAIIEIDEGKGIPHDQVKKMYPEWFKK